MAAWRRAIELSLGDGHVERLTSIAQSRSEAAGRVERARILLAYREDPSVNAGAKMHRLAGVKLHHQRCSQKSPRTGGFFVGHQTSVGLSAGVSELVRL